jgi:hypothetical protein
MASLLDAGPGLIGNKAFVSYAVRCLALLAPLHVPRSILGVAKRLILHPNPNCTSPDVLDPYCSRTIAFARPILVALCDVFCLFGEILFLGELESHMPCLEGLPSKPFPLREHTNHSQA